MKRYSGAKELLEEEISIKFKKLNRGLLEFLDSIRLRQDSNIEKIGELLDDEKQKNLFILARFMDEQDFIALRKMILDQTNDLKRDLHSELDRFTIRLNLIQEEDENEQG